MFVRRLVSGVRSSWEASATLRAGGVLQRREHRVEAGGEAAQLVVAADVDAARQVARVRHVLRRLREALHGRERRAGDHEPERGGQADPAERDEQEDGAQARERVVDLGQGARHLSGEPRRERDREDPDVDALDVGVAVVAPLLAGGDGAGPLVDRQRHVVAGRAPDVPVGCDELDVALGAAQHRARDAGEDLPRVQPEDVDRHPLEDLCAVGERLVHLPAQLAPHREVGDERGDGHGDGHCQRRGEGEAGPEAHRSRSAYPTPRTVWMRRGRPPASVLRRR
jgi:hypothetical protein